LQNGKRKDVVIKLHRDGKEVRIGGRLIDESVLENFGMRDLSRNGSQIRIPE
jgi:hypothetical protein